MQSQGAHTNSKQTAPNTCRSWYIWENNHLGPPTQIYFYIIWDCSSQSVMANNSCPLITCTPQAFTQAPPSHPQISLNDHLPIKKSPRPCSPLTCQACSCSSTSLKVSNPKSQLSMFSAILHDPLNYPSRYTARLTKSFGLGCFQPNPWPASTALVSAQIGGFMLGF